MPRRCLAGVWVLGCALTTGGLASAANGPVLHGIGAVHSSLGGAGVALPTSALAALHQNPALLPLLDSSVVELGAEIVEADNAVTSSVGPFAGRTEDVGDAAIVPALGFVHRPVAGRWAAGAGFLGTAGFATNYPQDAGNPLLAPQPLGYGRAYGSYRLVRVPLAFGWRLGDRAAVGVALNAGQQAFAASPAGFAAPDCSAAGQCYFPSVEEDTATGVGFTVGAVYRLTTSLSLGASYVSEQEFEEFEWTTTVANPTLPTFGTRRDLRFQINPPAIATLGAGWQGERLAVALDWRWMGYGDARGFGSPGPDPATGLPRSLGWEDIQVVALGAQYRLNDRFVARAGVNLGDNPIPPEASAGNVLSPAVFEDHYAAGLGVRLTRDVGLDLAYYRATNSAVTGPLIGPSGPVPGTAVTNEIEAQGLLFTLAFRYGS